MSLSNMQYDTIMRAYNKKQLQHRHILDEHIQTAYAQIPKLGEINARIASISIAKARARLNRTEDTTDLASSIQALASQRRELLLTHGFPADYLELQYDCPLCRDTGYIENRKCSCFRQAEISLLYDQSNIRDILEEENFSKYSLEYYSHDLTNQVTGSSSYDTAVQALKRCRTFTETFGENFENLFIYGDTGVGKTFLSHCIAKDLIDRSFCVIYFTAFDLFDLFAKHTFATTEEARELHSNIFSCDLLIIDDLGTELTNSFVSSQFFLCINERLMHKKSTVISTNLSLDQLAATYSERTFSRISSNYSMIKLFGNDIRIQKKLNNK
ncbi:MAG: ATP-binding protein [Lachnospiraceae bacterium]|nr:ATP-binding protein [Lachnospiraceae bacterium]